MQNDQLDTAIGLETQRLATQAQPSGTLVSQTSAQAERTEIVQVINTSGVASVAGTANQITASSPTGAVVLSLPATVTITTAYQVGGVQVVNTRKTGWSAWTGTNDRTSHATYSGTASVGYVQAELQGVMDSLKQVSEAYKALLADLTSHGLVGS